MSNTDSSYTPPPSAGGTFEPRTWQALEWVTLLQSDEAPTAATGNTDAYWLDYDAGNLYGPATFDPGIPGWDWGSPLANVDGGVGAGNGPENAAYSIQFYVWDENETGDWVLFQRKTTVDHDDLIRSQSGSTWEAVSSKMDAEDVWYDTTAISPDPDLAATRSVKNELHNINTNHVYAYLGGREYTLETSVSGSYQINPFDANAFALTITGDTTLSFASGLNALDSYDLGTRFAEITVLLIQDGTGGHTVGWSGNIWWHSSENGVSTSANHRGIWKFVSWDNGTNWYGHRWGNNFQD